MKRRRILNSAFLLSIASISIILLLQNKHSQNMQIAILVFTVIAYLVWAAVFHKLDKSLTLSIYLEYLLTAALVLILLMGVVF